MMCILQVFFLLFLFPVYPCCSPRLLHLCQPRGRNPSLIPLQTGTAATKSLWLGFNLRCGEHGLFTVLNLPYSSDFLVRGISYTTKQLQLYNSDNCIANRLLRFNLSGSPFDTTVYQNYTFLTCPKKQLTATGLKIIDCLSNSTTSVLATSSAGLINSLSGFCEIITSRLIPVSLPVTHNEGFGTDLKDDIILSWSSPNCEECEALGGICGFHGNDSQDVGCSFSRQPSQPNKRLEVFRLICLSISVPIVLCTTGISSAQRNRASTAAAVAPQPATITTGLDESTIESYEKLVLGESKRVLGPDGPKSSTCAICLSEYSSKETLIYLPECHHCSHADCIGEWLKMNGTCPVCCNCPSPAHVHAAQ